MVVKPLTITVFKEVSFIKEIDSMIGGFKKVQNDGVSGNVENDSGNINCSVN